MTTKDIGKEHTQRSATAREMMEMATEIAKIIDRLFEKLPSNILIAVSGVVIMLLGALVSRLEIPSGPSEQRWVVVCTVAGALLFASGLWKWFREVGTPSSPPIPASVTTPPNPHHPVALFTIQMDGPSTTRTVFLDRRSGSGSPDYVVEGSVRPMPGTGVWIVRRKVSSDGARATLKRPETFVFETDLDAANNSWRERLWFGMADEETRVEFELRAVVPDEVTRLFFQHHWAYRKHLLKLEHDLGKKTPPVKVDLPRIPLPEAFEPKYLANTHPVRVIVTRK